jgi:hypothetical protein
MQQASFKATALQEQVNTLTAKEQSLNLELDGLRNPQRLALAAKKLGMVPPSQPAFISLDGRVLGTPTPAVADNAIRINPLPASKPASLKRKVVVIKVRPSTTRQGAQTDSRADTRGSSTAAAGEDGRKKGNASAAQSGASH